VQQPDLQALAASASSLQEDSLTRSWTVKKFGLGSKGLSGTDASEAEGLGSAEKQVYRQVPISPGIYLQDFNACMEMEDQVAGVGSRCLAIFGDGQCAYSAVSSDGIRCVQAQGVWEVVNGNLLIGGTSGNAVVKHLRLGPAAGALREVPDAFYEESIYIDVDDLANFNAPVTLAECVPRVGESWRDQLLKLRNERDSQCQPVFIQSRPASPGRVDFSTQANEKGKALAATPVKQHAPGVRNKLARGSTLAATSAMMFEVAPRNEEASAAPGIRKEASAAAGQLAPPSEGAGGDLASESQLKWFPVCPLKPGKYRYETGPEGSDKWGLVEMVLHADSSFDYRESRFSATLKSVQKMRRWYVQSGNLILTTRERDAETFMLKRERGKKDIEQRIGRLEIPVATVKEKCTYEPFPQQSILFPGHNIIHSSKRVGGLMDPASPALLDPPIALDLIPLHAFEGCLLERGLRCDDIVSDISFMDNNKNGMLDAEDFAHLKTLGAAVASPEQLSELREALLRRFATLNCAFEACQQKAEEMAQEKGVEEEAHEDGRRNSSKDSSKSHTTAPADSKMPAPSGLPESPPDGITFPIFERFLRDCSMDTSKKHKKNSSYLKTWLQQHTREELKAIFKSLDLTQRSTIDLSDFLTLSLHTAMASIRRLDHFQSWTFERFGRSKESFAKAFETLADPKSHKLTDRAFTAATAQLGYPCGPKIRHCIFGLIDRDFKGVITLDEWEIFRSFNSRDLLEGLDDLKNFAKEKFGGIDACWDRLVQAEKIHKTKAAQAGHVSLRTFRKACQQGGFANCFPNADLEMLFIFLDEASDQCCNGYLTSADWQLLHGFEAKTITGSPGRLRRFLENEFGSMDKAWQQLSATWRVRIVKERIEQLAMNGLVRALLEAPGFGKNQLAGGPGPGMVKAWQAATILSRGTGSKPRSGKFAAAARSSMRKSSPLNLSLKAGQMLAEEAEQQRPHTHEGARTSTAGKDLLQASALRCASRGKKTLPVAYDAPYLPPQLRTELWEMGAPPQPSERPIKSAPSSDQRAAGCRPELPGIFLASKYGEQRCKLQAVEHGITPGLSARLSPMPAPSSKFVVSAGPTPVSARGSSRTRAVSAINWDMI